MYKDSFIGSFLYLLYGLFFLRKPLLKSSIGFLIGSCVSIYCTPLAVSITNFNSSFAAFSIGFLGMKIVETVLELDFSVFFKSKLNQKENKEDTEEPQN